MKKTLNLTLLPWLTLGLGGIGIALRIWLFRTGVDGKGLLIAFHPAGIATWVLAVCTTLLLFLQSRKLPKCSRYSENFPASALGFAGYIAAAAGILFTALSSLLRRPAALILAADLLGILCCPTLLAAGWCRLKSRRPSFLLHVPVCLYFILHLLCQYRLWSAEPQLQNYCFQLLACVGLMLTAYHRTAFDLNMGNRKIYTFLNLTTVFFCCLALSGGTDKLFYFSTGFWLFTNLCSLTPAAPREPEEQAS